MKKRPTVPGGPDQRTVVLNVPKVESKAADAKASKAGKAESKVEKSEASKVIMLTGPVTFESV